MKLGKIYTLIGIKEIHVNRVDGIEIGYDGLAVTNTDELDDMVIDDLSSGDLNVYDVVDGVGAVAEISLTEDNEFQVDNVDGYDGIEPDDDEEDNDEGDDYDEAADHDSIASDEEDEQLNLNSLTITWGFIMGVQLSWESACPASRRPRVRSPLLPPFSEKYSGQS